MSPVAFETELLEQIAKAGDEAALEAHLNSSAWKALAKGWSQCFEGSVQNITLTTLTRLGSFVKVDVA